LGGQEKLLGEMNQMWAIYKQCMTALFSMYHHPHGDILKPE
jgi:hypothetical protein